MINKLLWDYILYGITIYTIPNHIIQFNHQTNTNMLQVHLYISYKLKILMFLSITINQKNFRKRVFFYLITETNLSFQEFAILLAVFVMDPNCPNGKEIQTNRYYAYGQYNVASRFYCGHQSNLGSVILITRNDINNIYDYNQI